jgi:prepilin-type N-terminal cleavage/methylation domain-containing protein
MSQPPNLARGFTLVEMAIAVLVIGLILGSVLVPLSRQVEQRQIANTQAALDEIREALLGFALAKGYLPCPAVSATNGQEARTAGACTGGIRQGFLPWETLGASKLDGWGNIFRYSVTLAYASSAAPFSLTTAPDITIQTRTSAGALSNLTNANTVVAVVLSLGKNGNGGNNDQGVAQALPSTWPGSYADENTNASGSTTFVSRVRQDQGALGTGGEFDDIIVWLPVFTLFNRMVTARLLP